MKKIIILISVVVIFTTVVSAFIYRKKLKLLYKSLNSFKDKNLVNTFQNIYKIQPTRKIKKGKYIYGFEREEKSLPLEFNFNMVMN